MQNVIDNLSEVNTVKDFHDICCEFYHVMDENECVMHREFFEKLKKYRESKIERIVPLKEKDCIVMGNKYVELITFAYMSCPPFGASVCMIIGKNL